MSTPDHCPTCNALLAADQRYCLNCGTRLAQPRVDFRSTLGLQPATATTAGTTGGRDQRLVLVTVLSGLAAIVLALGVGIVIGRGNGSTSAPKAQVVTVNAAATPAQTGSAASGTAQPVGSISDDWPSSESGYTVEVGSIDKSSAQAATVASFKSTATSKGATAVGVLDGDAHSGTPPGKYVIYSGHYTTKAQADAAAAKLRGSFPGVIVLHVAPKGTGSTSSGSGSSSSSASAATSSGSSAASSLQGKSGSSYVQASKKLPKTVGTGGGAPPPKDTKKAGGGTSATCIGC